MLRPYGESTTQVSRRGPLLAGHKDVATTMIDTHVLNMFSATQAPPAFRAPSTEWWTDDRGFNEPPEAGSLPPHGGPHNSEAANSLPCAQRLKSNPSPRYAAEWARLSEL